MTAHQGIPITRNHASPAKAAAIRAAVAATTLGPGGDSSRLATTEDAASFH